MVAALGAALCLRNLHHAGNPALQLVVGVDPAGSSVWRLRAAARALAREIARCGLASNDIVVELATSPTPDRSILPASFDTLRDRGIRVAVVERGDGPACGMLPQPLPPDLVRIDDGWFSTIARQPATAKLFKALVRAYRSGGARILIDGIETASELRVAIDCGADMLCGSLLAPPALAGAVFPDQPLAIEGLLAERRVIPLFR
jgi:EAL domain-containing protein (putative c-di-GMP-specific phosphodiesterase class I)